MQQQETESCRDIYVQEVVALLGGNSLNGALAYTGTSRITHTDKRVRLYVNGKPGWKYYISITVSGADLYDIQLWGTRGATAKLLGEQSDLFLDDLAHAVEQLYDRVMNETNGGFIPL